MPTLKSVSETYHSIEKTEKGPLSQTDPAILKEKMGTLSLAFVVIIVALVLNRLGMKYIKRLTK